MKNQNKHTATWSRVAPTSTAHSSNSWSVTPDPNTWPGGHSVSLPIRSFLIWVMLKMACSRNISFKKILSSLFKSPLPWLPLLEVAVLLALLAEFERLLLGELPMSLVELKRWWDVESSAAMVGIRGDCGVGLKLSTSITWLVKSTCIWVDDFVGLESDMDADLLLVRLLDAFALSTFKVSSPM